MVCITCGYKKDKYCLIKQPLIINQRLLILSIWNIIGLIKQLRRKQTIFHSGAYLDKIEIKKENKFLAKQCNYKCKVIKLIDIKVDRQMLLETVQFLLIVSIVSFLSHKIGLVGPEVSIVVFVVNSWACK